LEFAQYDHPGGGRSLLLRTYWDRYPWTSKWISSENITCHNFCGSHFLCFFVHWNLFFFITGVKSCFFLGLLAIFPLSINFLINWWMYIHPRSWQISFKVYTSLFRIFNAVSHHLDISSSRFSFSAAPPPTLDSDVIVVIAPLNNPANCGFGYS